MITASEFALKMGVSAERVRQLCKAGRLPRARLDRIGPISMWLIPSDASDPRLKAGRPRAAPKKSALKRHRVNTLSIITPDQGASRQRLVRGRQQARAIIREMAKHGVKVELFGSMKSGMAHPGSDIDLLVTDCGDMPPEMVIYHISLLEQDIPVDVTILSLVPAHSLRTVMESARG